MNVTIKHDRGMPTYASRELSQEPRLADPLAHEVLDINIRFPRKDMKPTQPRPKYPARSVVVCSRVLETSPARVYLGENESISARFTTRVCGKQGHKAPKETTYISGLEKASLGCSLVQRSSLGVAMFSGV